MKVKEDEVKGEMARAASVRLLFRGKRYGKS